MTQDLAPCPFCGGEATIGVEGTNFPRNKTGCSRCNVWVTGHVNSYDFQKETWNRRTPTPDLGLAVEALRRIKAKLQTGPTTQSVIMDAWDNAKEWVLECPTGTLPREIFEGAIEEFVDDIDEALKSLGGE